MLKQRVRELLCLETLVSSFSIRQCWVRALLGVPVVTHKCFTSSQMTAIALVAYFTPLNTHTQAHILALTPTN